MRDNDGRKLDHKTLEALRLRAVDHQVQQGAHPEEVALALGPHRKTVYGWLTKQREGGGGAAGQAGGNARPWGTIGSSSHSSVTPALGRINAAGRHPRSGRMGAATSRFRMAALWPPSAGRARGRTRSRRTRPVVPGGAGVPSDRYRSISGSAGKVCCCHSSREASSG